MYIIKENTSNEIIVKKSKFICYLYKLNNLEDIKKYLETLKKEYKDATHITYAYVYENTSKYFDDNEPSGTAGLPILNILIKNKLTNTLAVVIRYFGGIKLGASGLLRTYSKSVKETLKKDNIIIYKKQEKYILETNYENEKLLLNLLKDSTIINKEYKENIKYTVLIDEDIINELNKNTKIKKYQL